MTTITHGIVFNKLEEWAPTQLAYDWDNVGLQVGATTDETKKIMITLDVLESVVDEAIEQDVNLIIAHHPLLFKPLQQINVNSFKGKIIKKLMDHEITVYAAHTNLDIAKGGVNDLLCDALNIPLRKPLVDIKSEKLLKLAVFVPHSHADRVRDALGKAGAGFIGNYSHCTFQTEGQGTFMPMEGTDPFIGSTNKLEFVDEYKIETIIEEKDKHQIVTAMQKAHPYEEVAYDLYPLQNSGQRYGLGRIGSLQERLSLKDFCEKIKQAFDIKTLRVTGSLTKQINKVAIVGGSGEKYLYQAKNMGADAFITGDVTFHLAQEAQEMGLAVIDPGHYIENVMKQATKKYLDRTLDTLPVIVSETNTDPFQFI